MMVSKMEADEAHQGWHEVSTTMSSSVDIGPSSVSCSPEGSSVDRPTPQEVAIQLQGYIQRLQECRALVKIPPEPGPTLAPMSAVPRAEAMVQAILGTQPGPALPRLEKMQIDHGEGWGSCLTCSQWAPPRASFSPTIDPRGANPLPSSWSLRRP